MFVENETFIDIVIYYKKIGIHYEVYSDSDFDSLDFSDEDKKNYTKLTIKAKQLTWGLYNDLQEAGMVKDGLGNRNWHYKSYKENKLLKIIYTWDAKMKDHDGKIVPAPINPHVILMISPDVAEVILSVYDQKTTIDEDDEKKS